MTSENIVLSRFRRKYMGLSNRYRHTYRFRVLFETSFLKVIYFLQVYRLCA